jgi:transposase
MVQAKAMSKKELAAKYNVTNKTLYKWLEPIGKKIGLHPGKQTFKPAHVKIIFQFLDEPETETQLDIFSTH